MNRILRILFLAIVFFMGYLWFGQIFKSCNRPKSDIGDFSSDSSPIEQTQQLPNNDFFSDEDTIDYFPESGEESGDPIDYKKLDAIIDSKNQNVETPVQQPEPQKIPETITKVDKPVIIEAKPVKQTTTSNDKKSNTYQNDSKEPFLVIAGSYLVEENASQMISTLKTMGYKNAEKIVFDLSKFYSVCVGRYPDHETASSIVRKLKANGIESYVHSKK